MTRVKQTHKASFPKRQTPRRKSSRARRKLRCVVQPETKTDNAHRVNSFSSSCRIDATSIQRLVSCFHSASYVTIIILLSGFATPDLHFQWASFSDLYS